MVGGYCERGEGDASVFEGLLLWPMKLLPCGMQNGRGNVVMKKMGEAERIQSGGKLI